MPAKVRNNGANTRQFLDERTPVFTIGRCGMKKHDRQPRSGIPENQRRSV